MGSAYYLHIENDFEAINVVRPETAVRAPQATPAESISKYGLNIYTTWTTWGSCSTCDVVGMKFRYGYCTISLETTHDEYAASKSAPTADELQRRKREGK